MGAALQPDDARDVARKLGGVLFGLGALMVAIRKQGDWGSLAMLLVYLVPAVVLYGGVVATRGRTDGPRSWQTVLSVFGLLFVPLALAKFVTWIGGTPSTDLNQAWIFGLTAALAVSAALAVGVRYQLLLGSLALLVAWINVWDKVIGFSDDLGLLRLMLGIFAILLLLAGLYLWRSDSERGLHRFSELLTAAGLAAVVACGLSGFTAALAPFAQLASAFGGSAHVPIAEASVFWDTLLLLIGLGLVGVGSRIGVRGPVYVGAFGLLLFLFIAGRDLDSSPPDPTHVVGWPLILLVLGAGGLLLSLSSFTLGDRPREFVRKLSGE